MLDTHHRSHTASQSECTPALAHEPTGYIDSSPRLKPGDSILGRRFALLGLTSYALGVWEVESSLLTDVSRGVQITITDVPAVCAMVYAFIQFQAAFGSCAACAACHRRVWCGYLFHLPSCARAFPNSIRFVAPMRLSAALRAMVVLARKAG